MAVLKAIGSSKARQLLSTLMVVLFALSVTTIVPAQAMVAAHGDHHAAGAVPAVDHQRGDHAAAQKAVHCDDANGDGAAGPHGGSCCQMSCHAALPVQAMIAARAQIAVQRLVALAILMGPQRNTSIDRPPRSTL